jgi:hypothetical protein
MSTAMYKALAFVDERKPFDPGYLDHLDLRPDQGYVPQGLSLGTPSHRPVLSPRPGRHGVDDTTSLFGARSVGLTVALLPQPDIEEFSEEVLAEKLMAWFHPAIRFRVLLAHGRSIMVRGEAVDSDWDFVNVNFHELRCSMVAPEGAIESAELYQAQGNLLTEGYETPGRSYSLDYDRRYPDPLEVGSNDFLVFNKGRIYTYPVVTFVGPCTNPALINTDTGERIQVNCTLTNDQVLTIDMERHRVLLDGFPAYYQNIDFRTSSWWGFPPQREVRMRFVATNYDAGSSGMIEWRDRYL